MGGGEWAANAHLAVCVWFPGLGLGGAGGGARVVCLSVRAGADFCGQVLQNTPDPDSANLLYTAAQRQASPWLRDPVLLRRQVLSSNPDGGLVRAQVKLEFILAVLVLAPELVLVLVMVSVVHSG